MKRLDEKAYHLYMRTIDLQIEKIKKDIERLPDMERVRKLTYKEWVDWQDKKDPLNLNSIKFHER